MTVMVMVMVMEEECRICSLATGTFLTELRAENRTELFLIDKSTRAGIYTYLLLIDLSRN